jgi:hypothetical protein
MNSISELWIKSKGTLQDPGQDVTSFKEEQTPDPERSFSNTILKGSPLTSCPK